jgi:hypothetical protein
MARSRWGDWIEALRRLLFGVPVPAPPPVPVDLRSDAALTEEERIDLLEFARGPGYPVLLKLMKATCRGFSESLLQTDPANEREVLTAHVLAQSAWLFMTSVQKQVNAYVTAADEEQRQTDETLRSLGRRDFEPAADTPPSPEEGSPLEVMGIR